MKTLTVSSFRWLIAILTVSTILFSWQPAPSAHAATINVNSTADNLTAGDGSCTLREALRNANGDSDSTAGDCTAGSGTDTITFASSLDGSPITLTITGSGEDSGLTGDLDINKDIIITGNGADKTIIDATAMSDRVFQIFGGTVIISDLTIQGGNRPGAHPVGSGGGIMNSADLTLNNVHITGNIAEQRAGGIYNGFGGGSLTLNNSTVYANSSGTSGAGIFSESTLVVNNSTVSGNISNDNGGGLFVFGGTTTLNYATVTSNTADADNTGGGNGGGITLFSSSQTLNIRSSIIANNSVGTSGVGADCNAISGSITSLDYNLIGDTTNCSLSGGANDLTGSAGLGSLANNGGPTLTHALNSTSQAIDHVPSGTNGCGSTYTADQRGVARPLDGDGDSTAACDIGAVEAPARICSVVDNASYTLGDVTFAVPTGQEGDIECFEATQFPTDHPNATTNLETGEYWVLNALNSGGTAASGYSLNLTIDGLTFTPDINDKLCRYTGSGWDCGYSSHTATSITRNSVTALSPWTAGNDAGPTALTLESFTASQTALPLTLVALLILSLSLFFFISRQRVSAKE
ncbi:MAG: hypothetical protein H6658_15410 [Ardenticatenaceae bacterium]|nr:hypothetical protein [Ardenticatenaceae bacterium]